MHTNADTQYFTHGERKTLEKYPICDENRNFFNFFLRSFELFLDKPKIKSRSGSRRTHLYTFNDLTNFICISFPTWQWNKWFYTDYRDWQRHTNTRINSYSALTKMEHDSFCCCCCCRCVAHQTISVFG